MPVINITRHKTTQQQAELDDVIDLPSSHIDLITELSIFEPVPSLSLLKKRAKAIVDIIDTIPFTVTGVMCGGAPYFNSVLDNELVARGYVPCYPFTMRVHCEDEGVVYEHKGLVKTV